MVLGDILVLTVKEQARIGLGGEIQIGNNRRIMFLCESKETNTVKR